MKERRGTVARLAGLAEGVGAAARRRQRDRAPRVLLYDSAGHPRLLAPESEAFEDMIDAADQMLESDGRAGMSARGDGDPERAPSPDGVSVPATVDPEREADARGGTRDKG